MAAYYAGAVCASNALKISIGLFSDENCAVQDSSGIDIEDLLQNDNDDDGTTMKLSYHLLKQVSVADDCLQADEDEDNEDEDEDAEEKEKETAEICQNLYEAAGKCEQSNGFDNGIDYSNYDGGDNWSYENQAAQEELVCNFISSLQAGTYDETGEIQISGGRSTIDGGVKATGGHKFGLAFFILGTVGLAGYTAMLHKQLTKGSAAGLSDQGGAMA